MLRQDEVGKLKKFKFRLQVVLDMREKELEQRQMEMSRILTALNEQQGKLQAILNRQEENTRLQEELSISENLEIFRLEEYRTFGIKLTQDARNQERIISNTKAILARKQQEVKEAHQKVEVLKKLKEKQEKQYYQEFLHLEMKEIDDITSARFKIG